MSQGKNKGLTIIELLVAIGIIAVVVAITIPAINAMQKSSGSTGTVQMISATLSNARTIATSRQQYVGVRFQKTYNANPLKAEQYMIITVYSPIYSPLQESPVAAWFIAVEGCKPIKLPSNTGVIDMTEISGDGDINDDIKLSNATTFSIVFSPVGKLIIYDTWTGNKNGVEDNTSKDDVFNSKANVMADTGMFIQDDTQEKSRTKLTIYDRSIFDKLPPNERYSKYLVTLKPVFINFYTGMVIE